MDEREDMKADAARQELEMLTREWLRSFIPSETTIDGGLFPSRIGDGMLGYDYDELQDAGAAVVPDPRREVLIPSKRPLPRS